LQATWWADQGKGGLLDRSKFFSGGTYDITPDGQRFLMIKDSSGADAASVPRNLIVVLSWTEELKRLVPPK
jgi:hypothetical protein